MAMTVPITRKADRRTETEDLRVEVMALMYEREDVARQLRWLSRLVMRSVLQQRDDLGVEASGHLDHIASRLERQGGMS